MVPPTIAGGSQSGHQKPTNLPDAPLEVSWGLWGRRRNVTAGVVPSIENRGRGHRAATCFGEASRLWPDALGPLRRRLHLAAVENLLILK